MFGILIQYSYDGDEAGWQAACDAFTGAIDGDAELGGRFTYCVNTLGDGTSRVHVGRWPDQETLALVQSRDYFKTFAGAVQGFAGDTLNAQRFETKATTA